jgi:ribosomal RNA-processing protein 12
MDLFLTSNNREIVKSCLGFVKVCVIGLPVELMLPRLSTLVPNLIVWSHEHKGHFKAKVKHILERMVRRFGYDNIHQNCPDDDKKLIVNIRKTKERSKKKKDAAKGENDGEDSDDDEEGQPKRQFENEYDQALYSSDSDDDGDSDNETARPSKKAQKGGKTYIVEDDDEPLDLLDKKALANISSTKPVKMRKPTRSKAKYDLDGKLILGKDSDDEGAMDVDDPNPEASGVGAYVAALKGKDVAKRGRGGKLKFSNRRSKDDDEDFEMDDNDAAAVKSRISPGRDRGSRGNFRGRDGGRGRGGRGGGRGGNSGRGGISAGRRGLGIEKRHGQGGVGKPRRGRN